MGVDAYDYALPPAAIAQVPAEPRDAARLLDATASDGTVVHRVVRDLPALVGEGDVIVVNDSRVLPARLTLAKATGGRVEVLLLDALDGLDGEDGSDPSGSRCWTALVRPSRRVAPGTRLFAGDRPVAEVGDVLAGGRRRVHLLAGLDDLEGAAAVALPPYVQRPLADPERYQTVYARRPGSVAAPTAGLHLTPAVLARCRAAGAAVHRVDLAVGLDTFRPITTERVEDHQMHSERYDVPAETMQACQRARRVIAVGTTTVRALESAAATGRLAGRTSLFISGDYRFRMVDVLLTNFHMPRSSLLVLLAAFCGDRWRALYREALDGGYRFLSFGDAMVVARRAS